jgi:hypothetical protein
MLARVVHHGPYVDHLITYVELKFPAVYNAAIAEIDKGKLEKSRRQLHLEGGAEARATADVIKSR